MCYCSSSAWLKDWCTWFHDFFHNPDNIYKTLVHSFPLLRWMDTNFLLWPSPHHGCQLEVRNKAPNLHNLKSSLIKEQNFPLQNMKVCLVSFLNLSFSNLMGELFLLPPWNHKFLEDRKPIIPIHLSIINGHSLSISRVSIILCPCLSVSKVVE